MDQESLRLLDDLNEGDRIEVDFGTPPVFGIAKGAYVRLEMVVKGWAIILQDKTGGPIRIGMWEVRSIKRLSRARKP